MKQPIQAKHDGAPLTGIPNVNEDDCGNWKLVDTFFVDNSGFGVEGELALTIDQFFKKVKADFGYGVIEAGRFQVYVGCFKKVE